MSGTAMTSQKTPEVTGPMAALMLLVSGRDAAIGQLDGAGVAVLRARTAALP